MSGASARPYPSTRPYLSGLRLDGRRVVVVGGGTLAQRRLPGLLGAGAAVLVVAPQLTPAVEAMVASGEIAWRARAYAPGDLDGAWFVAVCTAVAGVGAAVAGEAEARRIFCVHPDEAELATAVGPAVGEHDGLSVGVLGSAGQARRASAVRHAIVEALRQRVIRDEEADPVVAGVALVGGGPGDPDLLTVRARRLLSRADVVITDRLGPRDVLDELAPHVEVIDASKIPYGRAMAQQRINELLIEHARAGRFVVRLKGGDPFVYGRGFEEVIACTQAGVPVTVVPGVTSAFAAPAAAGIPVTHRGVAHEVVVVSGHVAPDHPDCLVDWAALGRLRGTLVLMMAVERIAEFAAVLIRHGRPPTTPVAVVQDATTHIQRVLRATLETVAVQVVEQEIHPPSIIVIGPVAGLTGEG